jgi:hypothetical protein
MEAGTGKRLYSLALCVALAAASSAHAAGSDSCASATVVPSVPFTDTTNTTAFTTEPGEDQCSRPLGHKSAWYQLTVPASGTYRFDTAGTPYDTILEVYSAGTAACGSLASRCIGSNDDANWSDACIQPSQSMLTVTAGSGDNLLVRITSKTVTTGALSFAVKRVGKVLVVAQKATKITIPKGQTSIAKAIRVKVLNPESDASGQLIKLGTASFGAGCPTLSAPDFDSIAALAQSTTLIAPRRTKTATVFATVNAADVSTPNPLSPRRCHVRLYADGSCPELIPYPSNYDSSDVYGTIDIIDKNDF